MTAVDGIPVQRTTSDKLLFLADKLHHAQDASVHEVADLLPMVEIALRTIAATDFGDEA